MYQESLFNFVLCFSCVAHISKVCCHKINFQTKQINLGETKMISSGNYYYFPFLYFLPLNWTIHRPFYKYPDYNSQAVYSNWISRPIVTPRVTWVDLAADTFKSYGSRRTSEWYRRRALVIWPKIILYIKYTSNTHIENFRHKWICFGNISPTTSWCGFPKRRYEFYRSHFPFLCCARAY